MKSFTLTIRTSELGSEDVFLRRGRRIEVKTNGEKRLEATVMAKHLLIIEFVIWTYLTSITSWTPLGPSFLSSTIL